MRTIIFSILTFCMTMAGTSQSVISTSSSVPQMQYMTFNISFQQGKSVLYKTVGENDYSLKNIISRINENMGALRSGEYYISLISSVRCDDENENAARRLARKRALTLKSYLIKNVGAEEDFFRTELVVSDEKYLIEGIQIALRSTKPIEDNTVRVIEVK